MRCHIALTFQLRAEGRAWHTNGLQRCFRRRPPAALSAPTRRLGALPFANLWSVSRNSLQYSHSGSEQYGDASSSGDSSEAFAKNGLIGHAAILPPFKFSFLPPTCRSRKKYNFCYENRTRRWSSSTMRGGRLGQSEWLDEDTLVQKSALQTKLMSALAAATWGRQRAEQLQGLPWDCIQELLSASRASHPIAVPCKEPVMRGPLLTSRCLPPRSHTASHRV